MANEIPAVSVIVPMYNVEDYIGEMLASVLNQTLKNFELIIVDNGSTDGSAAIVEENLPAFGGRLNLIHLPVNTGNPAVPRNKGLGLSRGKYIFFMDSDDVITQTALEEMVAIAESSQADVVYFENYGVSNGTGEDFLKNVRAHENPLVKEPTIIPNDLAYRLNYYLQFCFEAPPWLKISRRDFLISNELNFPAIHHEDALWTFEILCLAKIFVVAPNACYIYRGREGAETNRRSDFAKQLRYSMERTVKGMRFLDEFMSGLEFFKNRAEYRYAVLNFYTAIDLNWTTQACGDLPPQVIFENFRGVFAAELGENSALISYLVTNSIMLTRNLLAANQKNVAAGGTFNLGNA